MMTQDHGHGHRHAHAGGENAHQGHDAGQAGHAGSGEAHTGHGHSGHDHSDHDQSAHDHSGRDHSGHERSGHDHGGMGHDHSGHDHVAMFRRLFWIMAVLAVPTIALSPMFAMVLGYDLPAWPWVAWVSPVLGTVMYFWGGRPFLTGAWSEIRARRPGMMLLIGLALTVAFLASLGASLGLLDHSLDFWWELALLVVIMLLGHWIEMRSLAQTTNALDSLAALLPDTAELVDGGSTRTVAVADLSLGDIVVVRPGGRVPADGTITEGTADVDESMITGESTPVTRGPGETVVAGSVASDSAVRVRVDALGEDTALAGIRSLVAAAQSSRSRAQLLADRAAALLFWFALGAAVLTAVAWSILGVPEQAVIRTVTVLVIACPHALGLAIPLVVSIATERAARAGILVKDRSALEAMRTVDTVLFDKTGTLTAGTPEVIGVEAVPGVEGDRVLAVAAAAERDSEHPLARAIVARAADVPRVDAREFRSTPGEGVSARLGDSSVRVGGPRLLERLGITGLELPTWEERGASVLHVLEDDRILGAIALADSVRPESREAVDTLREGGIEVAMITGDSPAVAGVVAAELGIDAVFAGVRPEDKSSKVAELQSTGRKVAMVGDGVNDAPALARADVGIAIGAGTDVAIASAGVVLASDDPRAVVGIVTLSRASYRKMKENLWWAAGYNLVAVPLAAGVLAGIGFVMPMSLGAILMSASTVVVALNAQLLRRLDLRPGQRIS